TLEQINMMAIKQHAMDISDTVSDLGKLLRYTVDQKEKPVKLIEEIRFIRSFMQIHAVRYGDRLTTRIEIPDDITAVLIPKLLLQPLLENAIQHGIGDRGGEIRVSAQLRDGDVYVEVEDDGAGM